MIEAVISNDPYDRFVSPLNILIAAFTLFVIGSFKCVHKEAPFPVQNSPVAVDRLIPYVHASKELLLITALSCDNLYSNFQKITRILRYDKYVGRGAL